MGISFLKKKIESIKFSSYCCKTIKGEASHYRETMRAIRSREIPFSALTRNEREQLCREDRYLSEIGVFPILGTVVEVFDMDLTEALQSLPELKRNVILMVFFLDMTEQETAEVLHKVQSTVHYHKKHSLKLLKNFLEEVDEKTGLSDPL